MPLTCLYPSTSKPLKYEPAVAQACIQGWFGNYFMAKHPKGIVLTELEYMARTTRAPKNPGSLHVGNRMLDELLDVLSDNFRKFEKDFDYRKFDVIGISEFADYGELLEVTIEDNWRSAATQVRDKLDTLRVTINKLLRRPAEWRASAWKPDRISQSMIPTSGSRWVCFEPTHRRPAPAGVILYEIHSLNPDEGKKPTVQPTLTAFDSDVDSLLPVVKKGLRKAIPVYDPGNSEYVIIMPEKLFRPYGRQAVQKAMRSYTRDGADYDFPGGHQLHGINHRLIPVAEFIVAGALLTVVTAGTGDVVIVAAVPAEVGLGVGTGVEATVAIEATETISTTQAAYNAAMVADAEATIAARGLPAALANAVRAAAPALRQATASSGVVCALKILEGSARADSPSNNIGTVRAVPVRHFVSQSGTASANSPGRPHPPGFGILSPPTNQYPQELSLGSQVRFDGISQIVIAHVSVR